MMKSQNYTSRQLILSRLECGLNVAFVVLLIVSLLTGRATAAESLVNPPIPIFDVLADTLFGTRLETGVSMNPIRRGIRILTLLTDQLESPGMLRRQTYTTFYPATILALFWPRSYLFTTIGMTELIVKMRRPGHERRQ